MHRGEDTPNETFGWCESCQAGTFPEDGASEAWNPVRPVVVTLSVEVEAHDEAVTRGALAGAGLALAAEWAGNVGPVRVEARDLFATLRGDGA